MNSKRDNLQAAAAILLIFLAFTALVFATTTYFETIARLDTMELRQESFSKYLGEKSVVIIDLKDLADEQEIINQSFSDRIHDNFNHINDNYSDIIENHMRIDQVSYDGIMMQIEELEKEIKLLEKRIK